MLKSARIFLLATIFLLAGTVCAAPKPTRTKAMTRLVGIVTDSITGEPLPFTNVYCKDLKSGVSTDAEGRFSIRIPKESVLEISSMGYEKKELAIADFDTLRVRMNHVSTELEEVVVRPKKKRYSKKNNPAVDLMQRVRADHDKIDPTQQPYYSYDQYDKLMLGLNNYNGYIPDGEGKVKGKMKSLSLLVDTAIWTGKRVLDLSMKEKISTRITEAGGLDKTIITGQRSNGVDKNLDDNYTRVLFDDMLREADVYANDIPVMRGRYVSPLSPLAADYYKFHIEDTVLIGKDRCVELSFAPHNPESLGFNGKLYIPADDSVKWVRRVMMRLPKVANVNYVENMFLSQTFSKDSLGYVHKTLDDIVVELHIVGKVGQVYMSRQTRYENHSPERRKDMEPYYSKIGNLFVIDGADSQDADFWNASRMLPLSYAESQLAVDVSPFRKIPLVYWTAKVVEIIIKGYLPTSKPSYFDIGPIDTFISYDGIEGWRLSLGGLTTANLSPHLFARGYVAYGFRDRRWKYDAELEYSFDRKKYHSREFARNAISVHYRYDVNNLGQHYMTNSARNLLNSIKRMETNLSTYERVGEVSYVKEWLNNLSLQVNLKHQYQESSIFAPFVTAGGKSVPGYAENSLRMQVRWAPGEKFMQTYNERHNVNRDAICLILAQTIGPKGLLGSEYTLNLTEFCLQKRFWFSAFGSADVIFKAAKLWNQVQYPALLWQNANIAYTVQSETFSLLNPMEFAMDQYLSLDLNYNFNGLLFNRIPLLKKLKLREVFTFKGFWGNLTRKNNPEYNDNLYRFPDPSATSVMGKTPYMEIGVGIDNILTFLRLDYIWRLTYRNKPGAPNSGLRFSLNFSF